MSETTSYDALPPEVRSAELTELIPADLRKRGVCVLDTLADSGFGFSHVVWVGGGGFYEWGWASSYVCALEHACDKVVSRIGGTRDGNP